MASTATTKRYGRQGGRWIEPRPGATCQTCRVGDARYAARHGDTGELWRVCETCAAQAKRLRAPITFEPLDQEAHGAR
ncbi:MAG: hypothetical protein L0206_16810 [Actinobacteria bacterium]|nr:hypothetical protein [Actinomycetota bacterium]